ncbi:MAG TPA: hypothetical protein VHA12_01690, partial [Candidatus Nanoarchaeia archaeon]|nr:hypothetical protein [Candidatus Nanoarchaeia archaeon]
MSQTISTTKQLYLYEKFDNVSSLGFLNKYKTIPKSIKDNLNPKFPLRPYQEEAFARFFYYNSKEYPEKSNPTHLLF